MRNLAKFVVFLASQPGPPCKVPPMTNKALLKGLFTIVVPSIRPAIKPLFLMGGTFSTGGPG